MVRTELFGGAIIADFPGGFTDISNVRQVPDNQEVFVSGSNVCIVVEVLERVQEPSDTEAVKFHFQALAHDNDAISSTMQHPFVIQSGRSDQPPRIVLRGSQRVRKFNASAADDVAISVALFRINSKGKSADLVVSESVPRDSKRDVNEEHVADEFASLIDSLRIVDYDLFADSVPSDPNPCTPDPSRVIMSSTEL